VKTALIVAGAALLCILLVGCAAGPNELARSANRQGTVAGFWPGLWHGLIAPVTFIISLFSRTVQIYEVHNNGNWYNFGFLLGMMIILGGGGGGAAARRNRR
jgi:hypothetical protein